jgi:hypothetical protein
LGGVVEVGRLEKGGLMKRGWTERREARRMMI